MQGVLACLRGNWTITVWVGGWVGFPPKKRVFKGFFSYRELTASLAQHAVHGRPRPALLETAAPNAHGAFSGHAIAENQLDGKREFCRGW